MGSPTSAQAAPQGAHTETNDQDETRRFVRGFEPGAGLLCLSPPFSPPPPEFAENHELPWSDVVGAIAEAPSHVLPVALSFLLQLPLNYPQHLLAGPAKTPLLPSKTV